MKVLIPLAEGFEEIEAVTIIDTLRRAEIDAVTASLQNKTVTGSHGITLTADTILNDSDKYDAVVLPGGMPGSVNLRNDHRLINIIKQVNSSGGLTAAICAAPLVLSEAGVLKGKKYTCYPGHENSIKEGEHIDKLVVADGTVITGKGAGCSLLFALEVVGYLKDRESSEKLKEKMIAAWQTPD